MAKVIALRDCGRLNVTHPTGPRRSKSRSWLPVSVASLLDARDRPGRLASGVVAEYRTAPLVAWPSRGGVGVRVPWDPAQYLKFVDHRLRLAVDLLNRVDLAAQACPRRPDGKTLLPFRRLFIVARA
jgi:hypothetical protein